MTLGSNPFGAQQANLAPRTTGHRGIVLKFTFSQILACSNEQFFSINKENNKIKRICTCSNDTFLEFKKMHDLHLQIN